MLNTEYICTWFRTLAGLTDADSAIWRVHCEATARWLESRLLPDIDREAEMDRLCMAAAGIAVVRYRQWMGGSGDEVRVGDITLKQGNSAQTEADYLAGISDLLQPEGFAFVQSPAGEVE